MLLILPGVGCHYSWEDLRKQPLTLNKEPVTAQSKDNANGQINEFIGGYLQKYGGGITSNSRNDSKTAVSPSPLGVCSVQAGNLEITAQM